MARCTDCIHYEACLKFADLRVILCGDKADTKCIMFKPTADVAPRAEFEALKDEADRYKRYYFRHDYDEMIAEAKAEVAREIFEEIEEYAELQIESLNIAEKVDLSGAAFFGGGKQAFVLLLDSLAELKKKYTEAEPPKGD